MTIDIEQRKRDRQAVARKQRQQNRIIFGWTAIVVIAIALAFVIWDANRMQREADEQIAAVRANLARLSKVEAERKAAEQRASKNRRMILQFLSKCRVPNDIPELTGAQIFAQHRGDSGFAIWVPEGSHQLVVTAELSPDKRSAATSTPPVDPTPTSDDPASDESETAQEDRSSAEFEGRNQTWSVPLSGAAGYLFQLETPARRDDQGAVAWQLLGNPDRLEAPGESILDEGFDANGWSYTGSDRVSFPNEASGIYRPEGFATAAQNPPPVEVYNLTLRGKWLGKPASLQIRAEVKSAGGAQLSPLSAAILLNQQESNLLMPYSGGGRFFLRQ